MSYRMSRIATFAAASAWIGAHSLRAEEPAPAPAGVEERLKDLERRNRELESRLQAVEGGEGPGASARPAGDAPEDAEHPEDPEDPEDPASPAEDGVSDSGLSARYGQLQLTLQIFGDVGFSYRNPPRGDDAHASFFFGSLGLLTSAQIGERFQALSETLIESEEEEVEVDQERLWARWVFSDFLYAKLGIEHTNVSRWNRLYNHGKWLETSIQRPFLARFEHHEGFVPMHYAGVELGGRRVTALGTLEYVGAVSNGRGPTPGERQLTGDLNDSKAFESSLSFLPADLAGLRVGGGCRFDEIPGIDGDPARKHSILELIGNAYVEYRNGALETLAEMTFLQNDDRTGGRTFDHFSAYIQVGYQVGSWTPYTRFDVREMERGDPYLSEEDVDLDRWEQIIGVRHDFYEHAVVKIELGVGREERRRDSGAISRDVYWTIGTQLAWFF